MSRPRIQAVRIDQDDLIREPAFWGAVFVASCLGVLLMPVVSGLIWLVCWLAGVVR